MYQIKITIENNGKPLGPAFDLAEVNSQLAALQFVQSLLTVAGANAWWGDPQLETLQRAVDAEQAKGCRLAVRVR